MNEQELYDFLTSKENQNIIEDYEDEIYKDLASDVCIKRYRESPTGEPQYYIDYYEADFDEKAGEKKFYKEIATCIKECILSNIQQKYVEGISDKELCQEYAAVCFDSDRVIDIAYEA